MLGRFNQADPLAYASSSHTPYNYGFNDPVYHNDPMGDYPPTVYIDRYENGSGGGRNDGFGDEGFFNTTSGFNIAPPIYQNGRLMNPRGTNGKRYWGGTALEYSTYQSAVGGYGSPAGINVGGMPLSSYSQSSSGGYVMNFCSGCGGYAGGLVYGEYGENGTLLRMNSLSYYEDTYSYFPGYAQQEGLGRFFTNEGDAYRYMWNSSFDADGKVQQEVAAFLTSKGIVVLPTEGKRTNGEYAKNSPRRSYNDFLPLSRKDGNIFVTFNGAKYQVLGQVHTHPNTQPFGSYEVASDLVTQNFLGVPVYMIRTDGFYNTSGTVLGTQMQFFNGTKSLIGGK